MLRWAVLHGAGFSRHDVSRGEIPTAVVPGGGVGDEKNSSPGSSHVCIASPDEISAAGENTFPFDD